MSIQLIQQYQAKVEKLIQYGGSRNESTLRKAFQDLLEQYARSKNLLLIPEIEYVTKKGHKVYPDGTLKDALRQDWGYWESKDEKDNINQEIASKFAKGYPNFNILFEDTHTAILYQNGEEVMSASFTDIQSLDDILTRFVSYESPEVREFHKAIEQFCLDVPQLAVTLRKIIEEQYEINPLFKEKAEELLEHCKKAINPNIVMADIREMAIQHILTEDIFMRVFDEAEFHRENNVAIKLQELIGSFYFGNTKRNIDNRIAPYYMTINARASQISDHHEKQKFLKALYENFYRAYNPKAADRLGVIYTPDEIVNFMIESTDYILFKHFNKSLGEPYVEILDPATGTGTFITEIIEYLSQNQLESKYENEIHCNEVAILPYYIANLNIEYTYKQKTGKYKEFENICFVDTLDNVGFLRDHDHQLDFFGLWDENAERIGKQNTKKISVIIGNPPYNANQMNENENNKNREYPIIDKRIKETYIKYSTAQKTKLYDMYARFIRWASDRIAQNGVIAFVSNNSFLEAGSFDGFRKVIYDEFSEIYIINLKGDGRTSGERRRKEGGNIFSNQIRVGVAIYFLVKKKGKPGCQIHYHEVGDYLTSLTKKNFLRESNIKDLQFTKIHPDSSQNWLNPIINKWDDLIPIATKETKLGRKGKDKQVVFKLYSLGVVTNRDEWVHDFNKQKLTDKIQFFIEDYNKNVSSFFNHANRAEIGNLLGTNIKWTRSVKNDLVKGRKYSFDKTHIVETLYRPFTKCYLYFDRSLNEMQYQLPKIFERDNLVIAISGTNSTKPFSVLATNIIFSLDLIEKTQCFPLYSYNNKGEQIENITDACLSRFQKQYKSSQITKQNILNYVYAVLHHPTYRNKYERNLKKEFPRIPLYKDFWQWCEWGKYLMEMHINYEKVSLYPLERVNSDPEILRKPYVPKLRSRKENGIIEIDTITTLKGIPDEVWDYQLGTYSAIEWILERYKEKTPKDPTIREQFNTYKFIDYKEQVIDLICRVCTLSVETMKIMNQMASIEV